ncbi:MAG: chorismate mutase [Verrucomicrobia bacterium]|nr:chorismate mutase [Kiritimatiellia bacterium]MCB1101539.1 chorismate mutase [Kiritimatiellia bacterium]MCP5489218.1 chorismate mutase [Verrucomicrobiota bacterium]
MTSLDALRRQIDALDAELVALLNRRAAIAKAIGEVKREKGCDLYVPSREREVLDKVCGLNRGPLPNHRIADIYRSIMTASLALEGMSSILVLDHSAIPAAVLRYVGRDATMLTHANESELIGAWKAGNANYAAWPAAMADPDGALWGEILAGRAMLIGGITEAEELILFMRRMDPQVALKEVHIAVIRPRLEAEAWQQVTTMLGTLPEWWGGVDDASGTPVLLARVASRDESAHLVSSLGPWVDHIALLQL